MDKYQKALNKIKENGYMKLNTPILLTAKYHKEFKLLQELVDQQSILEEYNVTPEILREILMTGQMFSNQPTFEECIREWKEKGYAILNRKPELTIESEKYDLCIRICKANLIYEISNYYEDKPAYVSPELHQLLSKTLKALEEMK